MLCAARKDYKPVCLVWKLLAPVSCPYHADLLRKLKKASQFRCFASKAAAMPDLAGLFPTLVCDLKAQLPFTGPGLMRTGYRLQGPCML